MKFIDWYEKNKEALTQATAVEAMRQAWEDGYCVATKEMYKAIIDGLRGPELTQNARQRESINVKDKFVICESCDNIAPISEYKPCIGYNDIRCCKCGSTKNAHNRKYMKKLAK